ncbi:hypothetical protein [Acinetobacter sp.]|uniref:hypothetical protein n=1 Tax=Acinetobacter sp. TaxID=472 RepID=UPI003890D19B
MKIWIVTEDLVDGDVGLRYFPTAEEAKDYNDKLYRYAPGYNHESSPHEIDTDHMSWNGRFEDENDMGEFDDEDEE